MTAAPIITPWNKKSSPKISRGNRGFAIVKAAEFVVNADSITTLLSCAHRLFIFCARDRPDGTVAGQRWRQLAY
jgi:hypothetical protein